MNKKTCENCGKELSRSGYYKHIKRCKPPETKVESEIEEVKAKVPSAWKENTPFKDSSPLELATEALPPTIKLLIGGSKSGPLTDEELAQVRGQNIAILTTLLTFYDVFTTEYGKRVTADKKYAVKHSDGDKELVASAQWDYLKSKGWIPSQYAGAGITAAVLTGYYVAPPLYRIEKNRKGGRKLFSRFFIWNEKRKAKKSQRKAERKEKLQKTIREPEERVVMY